MTLPDWFAVYESLTPRSLYLSPSLWGLDNSELWVDSTPMVAAVLPISTHQIAKTPL